MPRARTWLPVAIVALLALVGLVVVGRWLVRAPQRAVETVVERTIAPKEETIDLGSLVTKVRGLSRLETAAMRVMHVSTTRQSRGLIPDALTGDEVTFMAVGDVIAGIDLAELQRDHVRLDPDGTVILRLPPSQILLTRLDNNASRVLSRDTGVLRRRDPQLERRIRIRSEAAIQREAVKKGILPLAAANAEKKLAELLRTLGFEKVRFERTGRVAPLG
ncbi:MAG: DUF4230 domain-containing protein [Thermoanaerobaculia bacterium]